MQDLAIACACDHLTLLEEADFLVAHVEAAAHEEVAALAADQRQATTVRVAGWSAGVRSARQELRRGLDDVGVEAAAQAAVRGDHHQQRPPRRRVVVQQRVRGRIDAGRQVVEDPQHLLRVRPAVLMRSWARRSFDDETIFMAFVICCVDLVERMRRRMSISDGMLGYQVPFTNRSARAPAGGELVGELLERRVQLLLERVVDASSSRGSVASSVPKRAPMNASSSSSARRTSGTAIASKKPLVPA